MRSHELIIWLCVCRAARLVRLPSAAVLVADVLAGFTQEPPRVVKAAQWGRRGVFGDVTQVHLNEHSAAHGKIEHRRAGEAAEPLVGDAKQVAAVRKPATDLVHHEYRVLQCRDVVEQLFVALFLATKMSLHAEDGPVPTDNSATTQKYVKLMPLHVNMHEASRRVAKKLVNRAHRNVAVGRRPHPPGADN